MNRFNTTDKLIRVMDKRHIIAMGGGGFSMEPDNLRLDRYILQHVRAENPSVCFLRIWEHHRRAAFDALFGRVRRIKLDLDDHALL